MALDQSALLEVLEALKAAEADDKMRLAAETIYQALIEAELSSVTGAFPHQRTETRTGQRNGYRARTLSTTAGDLELRIPRLRAGSFFPSLLERRQRVDQSLFAVIMEAYLHGTSCATCSPRSPRAARRWSPPRSAPTSPSPAPSTSPSSSTPSPPRSAASPQGRDDAPRQRRRDHRVRRLPRRALEKIWPANPLERLNKEIKRRTDVVGVFPNPAALLRLGGAGPGRSPRRMAGRRQALPVRRLHDYPAPRHQRKGGSNSGTAHGMITT